MSDEQLSHCRFMLFLLLKKRNKSQLPGSYIEAPCRFNTHSLFSKIRECRLGPVTCPIQIIQPCYTITSPLDQSILLY